MRISAAHCVCCVCGISSAADAVRWPGGPGRGVHRPCACRVWYPYVHDADNATVEWGMEPIRRPKAGTGARSARPKAGTGLHWGHGVLGRHWPALGARSAGRRPALGARSARPKAGTGLHWGHGVPGCRPKAGAGRAEGPALRRAQCARGAVTSALCTARGSAVCAPYIYCYWYMNIRERPKIGT